jgi:hypothetical protein
MNVRAPRQILGPALGLLLLCSAGCVGALQGGTVTLPADRPGHGDRFSVQCLVTVDGVTLEGASCSTEGQSGLTNAHGVYRFAAVPGGDRLMLAAKDGYSVGRTAYRLDHDETTVVVTMGRP